MILIALAVVLWFTVSPFRPVANEKPELAGAVYSAVSAAGDQGTVDFSELTDFEWDRMYAFEAYTGDSEVSDTLGFAWGTGDDFRLPNDSFVLLLFAKERQVTGWVVLNDYESPGPVIEFGDGLFRTPIPRGGTVFRATLLDGRTSGGMQAYRLTMSTL